MTKCQRDIAKILLEDIRSSDRADRQIPVDNYRNFMEACRIYGVVEQPGEPDATEATAIGESISEPESEG